MVVHSDIGNFSDKQSSGHPKKTNTRDDHLTKRVAT